MKEARKVSNERRDLGRAIREQTLWTDDKYAAERYLKKGEAEARSKIISEISYKLAFSLKAKSKSFYGFQSADFSLS